MSFSQYNKNVKSLVSLFKTTVGQTFSRYKDLPIDMRYGRKDCNGKPKERLGLFPNAHWGLKKLLDWCTEQFRMSRRQCVALMGMLIT